MNITTTMTTTTSATRRQQQNYIQQQQQQQKYIMNKTRRRTTTRWWDKWKKTVVLFTHAEGVPRPSPLTFFCAEVGVWRVPPPPNPFWSIFFFFLFGPPFQMASFTLKFLKDAFGPPLLCGPVDMFQKSLGVHKNSFPQKFGFTPPPPRKGPNEEKLYKSIEDLQNWHFSGRGGGKRNLMDKTILWTPGRFWIFEDRQGVPLRPKLLQSWFETYSATILAEINSLKRFSLLVRLGILVLLKPVSAQSDALTRVLVLLRLGMPFWQFC